MKKITLAIFICVVISCKDKSYKNFTDAIFNIEIKESDIYKTKKLSEIIDTIEYIPIETSENSLIGKVSRIKYNKGKFYIFDEIAQTVFLYNEKGKFLSSYSKIGKGPFEYTELNDIDVDSEGNCYLIETRKIIKLDNNLKPLKEIRLPFGTTCFAVFNNEIALVHLGNEDEIHILSENGKELNSYLPYAGIQRKWELNPFIKFGSDLLYKPIHSDDIFSINSDSISLHTKIHFEKPLPEDFWVDKKSLGDIDITKYMNKVYYYCETKTHIFFRFIYDCMDDDSPFYTLYSKNNNITTIYTNSIKNDCYLSKYPPFVEEVISDGRFIAIIDATFFCEAVKNNPDLLKKWNSVTELSNPVIALIKFKEL